MERLISLQECWHIETAEENRRDETIRIRYKVDRGWAFVHWNKLTSLSPRTCTVQSVSLRTVPYWSHWELCHQSHWENVLCHQSHWKLCNPSANSLDCNRNPCSLVPIIYQDLLEKLLTRYMNYLEKKEEQESLLQEDLDQLKHDIMAELDRMMPRRRRRQQMKQEAGMGNKDDKN